MPATTEPAALGLRLDGRALLLGYRLGADALLVVLDLAAHAIESSEGTMVAASYRDIARRVGLSKDTVGRRIRVLRHAGVLIDRLTPAEDRFELRHYRLCLDVAGVELDVARAST